MNAHSGIENKTPGSTSHPDIRCRFGTGESLVVEQVKADNGWLYVINAPIEAPKSAVEAIAYQGTQAGRSTKVFLDAATKVGLVPLIESLSNSSTL